MDASDPNLAPAGVPRTRLLLVDDEPELRRVFRRTLERAGHQVVEASDGQAALELSRRLDFAVVVTDLCMPTMSGIQLLERLSVEAPELPVLFVSGSTNVMDLETARSCGAFDFLQKPVNLAELRARASLAVVEHHRRRERCESHARSSETLVLSNPHHRRVLGT